MLLGLGLSKHTILNSAQQNLTIFEKTRSGKILLLKNKIHQKLITNGWISYIQMQLKWNARHLLNEGVFNVLLSLYCCDAQEYAFWKSLIQGEAGPAAGGGARGHCQRSTQRSGCGIMATWRPSLERRPAMPSAHNTHVYLCTRKVTRCWGKTFLILLCIPNMPRYIINR